MKTELQMKMAKLSAARGILVVFYLLAAGFTLGAIDPSDLNSIHFMNQTGYTIEAIFYSPDDSAYWGPDVLGGNSALKPGDELSFYIYYPEYENRFDFMAVDSDGDVYVITDVLINNEQAALVEIGLQHRQRRGAMPDLVSLVITNATDSDIWFLFVSPGDSVMWGIDILSDTNMFYRGDSFELLIPRPSIAADFDILAIDENQRSLYRSIRLRRGDEELFVDISEDNRR